MLKHPRGLRGRGRARVSISRIERDQIHLRGQISEEFADGPGVGRRVVFPLDERPLVEDAAARGFAVGAARGHQFVERPFFRGGDERGAFGLVGGVEGNGEMHRTFFSGETENAWHDAHGAEGDALGPEREAVGIAENIDRVHDRIVVMERLAHAHEDEVAETLGCRPGRWPGMVGRPASSRADNSQRAGDMDGLGDDFAGGEMARVAHLARRTKHAAHRTTHLAADTGRDAAGVAHEDGLDAFGVGEGEEIFVREAVARGGFEGGG